MSTPLVTFLGKGVQRLARLRGGGSALPGLFMEKIDPTFIRRTLAQLPMGVVLVSGTNGKTTTTKMVVELLESQGLRVFTNRTGSNFMRGVAAALLPEVDHRGRLSADIAVLELDEAHAVRFVDSIAPEYCLLLNVMRDQLDRFGEIDSTAQLLKQIAQRTTRGIVLNRDDPRLASETFRKELVIPITTYGVSPSLSHLFPSDDALRQDSTHAGSHLQLDDTCLLKVDKQIATIAYAKQERTVTLKLKGIYNVLNSVAAIALVRSVMGTSLNEKAMLSSLEHVLPAFGRGESVFVDGTECELVLVKNPGGFRLSLSSFDPNGYKTMIAVNDNYADGRDMSWLWDVDFDSLRQHGVAMVSGIRAYDMALRLQYDEVEPSRVEPNLALALDAFLANHKTLPKRIYCTYTAMLSLRKELAKHTAVEKVL